MSTQLEELESLLFDWDSGTLDSEGVQRVREILRSDEEARAFYVQHQLLNSAMKLEAFGGSPTPSIDDRDTAGSTRTNSTFRPSSSTGAIRPSFWAVLAASLLICVLGGRLAYLEMTGKGRSETTVAGETTSNAEPEVPPKEATATGLALMTRLIDVEWDEDQTPLEVGDAVGRGRFSIASGFAQIEFFCGATVVVEGPAELELKSAMLARLHRGRLRAQVPPAARGFSVELDDMKVVDLGTEFGISMDDGGTNIQVFDGEVELHEASAKTQLLTTGAAVERSAEGEFAAVDITPESFLDIANLESRHAGLRDERFERWNNWSRKLRTDQRLIAYYAFDQHGPWKRRLPSSLEAANGVSFDAESAAGELDGAIVGAHRVPGRWESKGGLEFKRPGDRVRVQIPGEFGSLTFACWVKIDSLDRWYNSLFLTDHYNQGEPHWQILDTGQLFFSVRYKPDGVQGDAAKKPTHHAVLSPPFWKPSMSGRWLHLATTYDAQQGVTAHYLNGNVIHQEEIPADLKVTTTRIGAASIGNWSLPTQNDAEFAIRNINGSIDEFAIFNSALSESEIKEMFEHGKP